MAASKTVEWSESSISFFPVGKALVKELGPRILNIVMSHIFWCDYNINHFYCCHFAIDQNALDPSR